MIYQFIPVPDDPLRYVLPWGTRLRIIPKTRRGELVQVKDTTGEPRGFVSLRSLNPL